MRGNALFLNEKTERIRKKKNKCHVHQSELVFDHKIDYFLPLRFISKS